MSGIGLNFGYSYDNEHEKRTDFEYDLEGELKKKYMGKDYTAENQFLEQFDAAIRVNPEDQRNKRIARHVERFVEKLLEKTKEIEPNLELKVGF